jgi:hypothetical protein
LFDQLNDLEDSLVEDSEMTEWIIGTAATATTALTAGYVVWLVRGGYLFTGLMSSLPAWYRLDPLPVLDTGGERISGSAQRGKERGKSLVEIVNEESSTAGATASSAPARVSQNR